MFRTKRKALLAAIYIMLLWFGLGYGMQILVRSLIDVNQPPTMPVTVGELFLIVTWTQYLLFFIGTYWIINRLLFSVRTERSWQQEKQKRVDADPFMSDYDTASYEVMEPEAQEAKRQRNY